MNEELNKENSELNLKISLNETMPLNYSARKNFGYAALSKIYHELEIPKFIKNKQRYSKEEYDANSILKLLVYSRLLFPASKKKTFENKDIFFEKFDFSLDDVYRSLSFFNRHCEQLLLWIHEHIKKLYNRNTELVYYDVTNYYFEIDIQDELRRKGVSKEHRPDPIVQMGLFMDTNGIPITYKLFSGNAPDKTTLIPTLRTIQKEYSLGRIIVVADKGLTTGDNIWYILSAKNGYILSYSIRGADRDFQKYVLDEKGYVEKSNGFKIKSRLYQREIQITTASGKKMKKIAGYFYSNHLQKSGCIASCQSSLTTLLLGIKKTTSRKVFDFAIGGRGLLCSSLAERLALYSTPQNLATFHFATILSHFSFTFSHLLWCGWGDLNPHGESPTRS